MANRITLSIMPTANGRHRPDLYQAPTVGPDMPDEEAGEVIGDFLRMLRDNKIIAGEDMLELNVRIF